MVVVVLNTDAVPTVYQEPTQLVKMQRATTATNGQQARVLLAGAARLHQCQSTRTLTIRKEGGAFVTINVKSKAIAVMTI